MFGTTRSGLLLVALLLGGCAQTSDSQTPPGTEGPVEEQPFRPDLARSARFRAPTPTPSPPPSRFAERAIAVSVDAEQGEDGRGGVVAAIAPVKFVVEDGGAFAATATQPVLRVGEFEFRRYRVEEGALVFVAADGAALDGHSEAELQHAERRYPITIDWEPSP